jgi:DNA-binding transcriptional ArsR family regulator
VASTSAAGLGDRIREAVRTLPRLVGFAGYGRWDDEDPLEHDARRELCDRLEADPGTYLPALAETVGTARHHLRVLEREGLVTRAKQRGRRRYYPVGESPAALDGSLAEDGPRQVLRALGGAPGSVSEVADRVGRDPSTVSHHLSRLHDDGLVERERDGRAVVDRLAPAVAGTLTDATDATGATDASVDVDAEETTGD